MSFTRNVFQKRGVWSRFDLPMGFSYLTIHADSRGLIWFSQSSRSSPTSHLGYFDGLHTRNVLAELHIDVPLRHIGFSGDDRWWGITQENRLLSVDLKDSTVTDYTPLVPDLSNAYWLWATPKSSDIVIGIPNKLVRFDKQNATLVDLVSNNEVKAHGVAISSRGELWFTSNTGLYRYDGETIHPMQPANWDPHVWMWEILVSRGDVAWISTIQGVLRVENGSSSFVMPELQSPEYTNLIEDADGNVWLKASDIAVSCVTPHGIVHFSTEDGLAALIVVSATQDRQKRLWFAGRGAGLCMYDPETFLTITPHCVNASCNSDKGVFLGTPTAGLLHWEEDALTVVNETPACGSYSAITPGPSGKLLVISARRLYEVDLETMESKYLLRIKGQTIRGTLCDRNGFVWIATTKRLLRYEGDEVWESSYGDLGVRTSPRASFLEFSRGVLVLAYADKGGLCYFEGKEPKWLGCMLPADNPVIVCGCEDSRKRLWLATDKGPVFCFDGTSTREVLPDGQRFIVETTRIIEDTRGAIWFGTTKGIVKYDGQVYQHLTIASGLPEDHIKGLNLLSNGDIVIATIRGAFLYHPRYEVKPFIWVSQVVTNVTHDAATVVGTHAGIPAVTFCYEGSSTKMGRLKYLYRLEGYEAGWRETWDEQVRYEGLPAGNYRFHVKAVDFDFMYSDEAPPATLQVEEDPSKKAMENLKTQLESTQDYSDNIIRSINDAIIVINTHGSIVEANQAALDLTGFDKQQLLGMHASRLLSEDCRQLLDDRGLQRIFDCHTINNLEGSLLASGGRRVPVLLSASVMCDRTGQVQGIVLTARDLTNYKALQQRLLQKQKMESLGALASGVAHDFNNLMSVVMGNVDLMRASLPEDSKDADCLADIEMASEHAARLCTELLNVVGKAIEVNKEINLSACVKDLVHLLRSSISRKITINCSLDPALPTILADGTKITQVVLNLLTNAAQAIGDAPGTISISARARHLDAQDLQSRYTQDPPQPGRYVILEIADTGCGIDPAILENIFDPFFSRKPTGRGLGLATVKGIVTAHNGVLQVKSTLKVGTTFTVCFPAYRDGAPESGPEKPAQTEARWKPGGTVLVVDDDDTSRALTERLLSHLGFSVIAAASGLEAVDKVKSCGEDLSWILMDVIMPEMDGIEAYSRIRKLNKSIPVVMTGGYSEALFRKQFESKESVLFLKKPYGLDQLKAVLGQIFPRGKDKPRNSSDATVPT